MESIVTCIEKSRENNFFTGLQNGKILEFKLTNFEQLQNNNSSGNINLNELKIDLLRSYLGHKDKVNGIYYSELLGLIITSGADRKIYIRKYYDLTLLTMINIENKFCINIKINHYYLYILLYDEIKKSHVVKVYSVNGLVVAKTEHNLINNICFDKNGNLMIGYAIEKKISVYNPSLTKKIEEFDLSQPTIIKLKKNKTKTIKVQDTFFLDFVYQGENSSIYCYFSNGNLIQKYLDSSNQGEKNSK
jgi:WD40 repeat protein